MTNYQTLKKIDKMLNNHYTDDIGDSGDMLGDVLAPAFKLLNQQLDNHKEEQDSGQLSKQKINDILYDAHQIADTYGCDDICAGCGDSPGDFWSHFYLIKNTNSINNKSWSWIYTINSNEEYYSAKITPDNISETGDSFLETKHVQKVLKHDSSFQYLLKYLNRNV